MRPHAIDRRGLCSSQLDDVTRHPIHWLISTQIELAILKSMGSKDDEPIVM